MRVPVSATGRRGEAAQLLKRLEGVADPISLHEPRSEEDRAVERGEVVEWDQMRGVRENGELAVRDVLIDLDGVLVDEYRDRSPVPGWVP